jgi:hypothetical protein
MTGGPFARTACRAGSNPKGVKPSAPVKALKFSPKSLPGASASSARLPGFDLPINSLPNADAIQRTAKL